MVNELLKTAGLNRLKLALEFRSGLRRDSSKTEAPRVNKRPYIRYTINNSIYIGTFFFYRLRGVFFFL